MQQESRIKLSSKPISSYKRNESVGESSTTYISTRKYYIWLKQDALYRRYVLITKLPFSKKFFPLYFSPLSVIKCGDLLLVLHLTFFWRLNDKHPAFRVIWCFFYWLKSYCGIVNETALALPQSKTFEGRKSETSVRLFPKLIVMLLSVTEYCSELCEYLIQ